MLNTSESGDAVERLRLTSELPYFDEAQSLGFKPVKVLRNSDRFITYKVTKDGQAFFLKGAKDIELKKLRNEVWFAEQLNQSTSAPGVAPGIISVNDKWYVSEFFEADPLCVEAACFSTDLTVHTRTLTAILLQIDELPVPSDRPKKIFQGTFEKLLKEAQLAVDGGVVSRTTATKALQQVEPLRHKVETRVQHGDFTPWHIFDLRQGKYGIVDAEHAGNLPRFNDLANLYTRLFNRCNSPSSAAAVLRSFIEGIDINKAEFWFAFWPIITEKALMGCSDALIDWVGHDYKASSVVLLERCVAKDTSALLD